MKKLKFISKFKKQLLLFFALLFVYNINAINLKYPESGDNLPVRYIPFSIIKEFNLDLDEYYPHFVEKYPYLLYNKNVPYYLVNTGGHYVDANGSFGGILVLPIFLFSSLLFNFSAEGQSAFFLTKFTASLLVACSAVFLYSALKIITKEKNAFYIALIYSLCSCVFSISSQQMWQHTGSEFFLTMSLYFLIRGLKQREFVAYSGFSLACAFVARPTNGIVFIVLSIYILHRYSDQIFKFVVYATGPILLLMWYNYYYLGSMFTSGQIIYGPIGALSKTGSPNIWSTPFIKGFLGLVVSPSRGLLVYSPIFIFSIFGVIYIWKKKETLFFKYLSVIALFLVIVASKWFDWWGGHTFGYRPIVDITPFLCIFLVPFFNNKISKNKICLSFFIILAIVSFCIQAIGAFLYDGSWDASPNVDEHQQRLWSWTDSQIVYYVQGFISHCRP